jgi:hypothetical protein
MHVICQTGKQMKNIQQDLNKQDLFWCSTPKSVKITCSSRLGKSRHV